MKKLALGIYLEGDAKSDIQFAWLELSQQNIEVLSAYQQVFETIKASLSQQIHEIVFTDDSPTFIGDEAEVLADEEYDGPECDELKFITSDGAELDIYGFDGEITELRSDQTFEKYFGRKMVQTYLHVSSSGVYWSSRDGITEDVVETMMLIWDVLDELYESMENSGADNSIVLE